MYPMQLGLIKAGLMSSMTVFTHARMDHPLCDSCYLKKSSCLQCCFAIKDITIYICHLFILHAINKSLLIAATMINPDWVCHWHLATVHTTTCLCVGTVTKLTSSWGKISTAEELRFKSLIQWLSREDSRMEVDRRAWCCMTPLRPRIWKHPYLRRLSWPSQKTHGSEQVSDLMFRSSACNRSAHPQFWTEVVWNEASVHPAAAPMSPAPSVLTTLAGGQPPVVPMVGTTVWQVAVRRGRIVCCSGTCVKNITPIALQLIQWHNMVCTIVVEWGINDIKSQQMKVLKECFGLLVDSLLENQEAGNHFQALSLPRVLVTLNSFAYANLISGLLTKLDLALPSF